jgi:hypothetical protein
MGGWGGGGGGPRAFHLEHLLVRLHLSHLVLDGPHARGVRQRVLQPDHNTITALGLTTDCLPKGDGGVQTPGYTGIWLIPPKFWDNPQFLGQ